MFGSTREGAKGESTYDTIAAREYDVDGRGLGIEIKHRKSFPDWLLGYMRQSEAHAETVKNREMDSAVVLVPKNSKTEEALVVVRLKDYRKLRHLASMLERLQ